MRLLQGHTAAVRCLAYSPDSRLLASGGADNLVILWDLASGGIVARLEGHEDWVRGVAFAPDGQRLASASWDNSVRLWSVNKRQKPRILAYGSGHGGFYAIAYCEAGQSLAVGSGEGHLCLWDLRNPRVERFQQLPEHSYPVQSLVAQGENGILSVCHGGRIQLSDTRWLLTDMEWFGGLGWLRAVAAASDGEHFVTGGDAGVVRLWSVIEDKPLGDLATHSAPITGLAYTAGGQLLLSASWDGVVNVWDVSRGAVCSSYNWDLGRLHALAVAPDGMTAAVAGDSRDVLVWDLADL
jgi:WD40 repeat protein